MTLAEVRRFVALYEQGESLADISALTGRAPSVVARWLHREGVPVRRCGPPPGTGAGRRNPTSFVCGRKFCTTCGRWRLLVDFGPTRRDPLGLQSRCRTCRRVIARERMRTDPGYAARLREEAQFNAEARRRLEGRPEPRGRRVVPPDPPTHGRREMPRNLPVAPLAVHVDAWLTAYAVEHPAWVNGGRRGVTALSEMSGVPPRRIWGLLHNEFPRTHYTIADRLATAMGLSLTLVYGEA
jgi:hypothetical protein